MLKWRTFFVYKYDPFLLPARTLTQTVGGHPLTFTTSDVASAEIVKRRIPAKTEVTEMKYVLVTGGVVSGLGKGVTASSIGVVLKACGLRVTSIKIGLLLLIDFSKTVIF